MSNCKSTTPAAVLTLMNPSSSTSSKDVHTGTTGRSGRKRYTGGLIGTGLELNSESKLWRAVLGQAVRDICSDDERTRREVLRWTATDDFDVVCEAAMVHPEDMRDQIGALSELSINLAKKYGRMLREKIVAGVHRSE